MKWNLPNMRLPKYKVLNVRFSAVKTPVITIARRTRKYASELMM